MPDLLVRSFAPLLRALQPCFTRPGFSSFWALTCAWILCSGRRSLTRVIQSGELGRFKHFCSFHRFFSQTRWNLDDLGQCIFQLLLPFCPEVLTGAVDDTLARKSGRHIWGAGMHHDPLRSTQKRPFFSFGHSWVVLSLHVSFPFAPQKTWALPVLVRLYRNRKNPKLAPQENGFMSIYSTCFFLLAMAQGKQAHRDRYTCDIPFLLDCNHQYRREIEVW